MRIVLRFIIVCFCGCGVRFVLLGVVDFGRSFFCFVRIGVFGFNFIVVWISLIFLSWVSCVGGFMIDLLISNGFGVIVWVGIGKV